MIFLNTVCTVLLRRSILGSHYCAVHTLQQSIYGGGLIFALHTLRLRARSYEHYEHLTSMLKPYEGKVSESSIAGFLYHCHNHLHVLRVVAQTERAQQLHYFLMTELLGTHSLFRAVNLRLSDWSVVHSGLNLSSEWLIVRTRWSKPIKTYWQQLNAFTHFSWIGILTQLDLGQPAFQALHIWKQANMWNFTEKKYFLK